MNDECLYVNSKIQVQVPGTHVVQVPGTVGCRTVVEEENVFSIQYRKWSIEPPPTNHPGPRFENLCLSGAARSLWLRPNP